MSNLKRTKIIYSTYFISDLRISPVPLNKIDELADWLDLFCKLAKEQQYLDQRLGNLFHKICELSSLEISHQGDFNGLPFEEAVSIVTEIANVNFDKPSKEEAEEGKKDKVEEDTESGPLSTQEYIANRLNRLISFGLCVDLGAALEIGDSMPVDLLEEILEERFQILDAPNKKEREEKQAEQEEKDRFNKEFKSGKLFEKMGKAGVAHMPGLPRPTTLPEDSPQTLDEAIAISKANKEANS